MDGLLGRTRRGVAGAIAIAPFLLCLQFAWAGDGVPVTSMSIVRTPAVPSGPYNIAGDTITYGVGDNVQITGVNVGAAALTRSAVSKPNITINRIDNVNVQGERLTFFYPGSVSGSNVNIEGEEATTMEQAMNDDYITSGGLDVFLNEDRGVEEANNIERIDFVVTAGINLPTSAALLDEVGTIANEKHGNNTYKMALITAIDAFGRPSGYGPLITVEGNVDYGNVGRPQDSSGNNLRNLYLRNGPSPVGADNGLVEYIRSDTNIIGLSFVSFAAMGATPGQTVYGYSLFPNDMFDTNDLVGLTDAPLDTNGAVNGGDIYGGTFAIFSSLAAELETSEGGAPNLSGSKTVSIYDPESDGLYAIPGNDIVYTIAISNSGNRSPDAETLVMIDTLPSDIEFFNGDMDGTSGPETDPVIFIDNASGLNLDYANDVRYSNVSARPTDFLSCTYSPNSGYDDAVRHVCIQPTGTMAHGSFTPSFEVKFRARIK